MAVEHLFAAVHIERRMAFAVQRTKSRNFLASLLASGLPTVLREKLQQRNAAGRREIRRHSWWRPRKSQAKMVGARKNCRAASQNGRLPMRLRAQRRMVEASATRSASRQSGAACAPPRKGAERATTKLANSAPYPNRIVPGLVRRPAPPAMSDDPAQAAARTPARRPLAVMRARLASVRGTWITTIRVRGHAPPSAPAKAHDYAAPPSLLSMGIHAEKEPQPACPVIGRFSVTTLAPKSFPPPQPLAHFVSQIPAPPARQ